MSYELSNEVCAQFLWETAARVLVDFTPGAAMMIKAALASFVKVIAVAHNEAHSKTLMSITKDYVMDQVKNEVPRYAPADKAQRMVNIKPRRLSKWETQQKRPADSIAQSPSKKRAESVSSRIDDIAKPGQTPSTVFLGLDSLLRWRHRRQRRSPELLP